MTSRTILRTHNRSNASVRELLSWVFAAELMTPSPEIWIAVAWISDIQIFDSTDKSYSALISRDSSNRINLSDFVVEVARRGSKVNIVTRPDPSNLNFIDSVRRKSDRSEFQENILMHISEQIHQKNVVGRDWVIDGSMNLTANGLDNNVESLILFVDQKKASETRTNLSQTWEKLLEGIRK